MTKLSRIGTNKILYTLLTLSMLYFLVKGIQYALIGSYVPILFIAIMIVVLSWGFTRSTKVHRNILRFWAILIVLWAAVRLAFWIILEIDTSLTESHLREQFGIIQNAVSILMLTIGVNILRAIKRKKT